MNKKLLVLLICLAGLCGGIFYLQNNSAVIGNNSTNQEEDGANQFVGKIDIKDSPYFKAADFDNMKSGGSLLLLEKFKTHQQKSGYTCGPVACNMVVEYFTGKLEDEFAMGKIMGTNSKTGTTIKGMVNYFEKIGWQVESSENSKAPGNFEDFLKWVDAHLKKGNPIIVENVDWGGHYRVIIGHDNMGTDFVGDDVLIMADPFDTCDHLQDGYVINHAEKFYYMWFDHLLFAKNKQDKPWIIARPK